MADIRPTPEQRPIAGGLARLLQRADKFARAPFGYENPPAAMVSDFLSIPPLYRTLENYAYGSPLASGTSSVSRYLPRLSEDTKGAIEGAINLAPMVGPAARATTAGATALGRLGERAAARAVPQIMERRGVGADLLSALASGTTSNVIKPKGGNWLTGDIEQSLKPLRSRVVGEEPAERLKKLEDYFADQRAKGVALDYSALDRERARMAPDVAINRWIDTKLNKYIRNEMATPEDPVRALAEQGTTHLPFDVNDRLETMLIGRLGLDRMKAGFPVHGMGEAPAARVWELATDISIEPRTAREQLRAEYPYNAETMPWLEKLDPETPVYSLLGARSEDLGFSHLIDELKAAMSPTSELPQHLRLDPKDIDKVTVPQAVERVSKINAWRAEQAAKAEREGMMANLTAEPRLADENLQLSFVEKPGGAWVDIPETLNEKGLQLCTSIGKAGGWCTKNEGLAKTYGSGENRLATLLDAEGRPHAQAKLTSIVDDESAFDAAIDDLTPAQDAAWEAHFGARRGPPELTDALEWMQTHAPNVYKKYQDILASQPKGPPDITELKPPGNTFNSDRAREYAKRDPDYKAKVTQSVLNFLNSGEWGHVADLHHYDIVDLASERSIEGVLQKYYGSHSRQAMQEFNTALGNNPSAPRFMTETQFYRFLEPSVEPPGYGVGGAVKSFAKLVRSYLSGEGKVAEAVATAAPKEQKMLMGVYRGYAGEAPGETVYHAGAEFARPNPGLFTNPERGAVEQFQRSTNAPKLHTFEAKPRRVGSDEDVYAMARRLGIYEPGVPAGQYLEQGENAIFPQSRLMVEELRNLGLDSLRLKDGMGKQPSLIVLDPAVVRPAVEIFASPQRRVADYYAQRRAAETGQAPHAEMLLVDPFAGEQYGHSTLGTGKNPPMITRARKLKPEDVVDRTQLYAKGGSVDYDPDEIAQLAASIAEGLAPYGLRHSGEGVKGKGYFGPMAGRDGTVTELSAEDDAGEYPLVVPTLTAQELELLLADQEPTEAIQSKARSWANTRRARGQSPFAGPTELRMPRPGYAAGGLVDYDPTEIDTIVSKLKEEFHG